MSYTAYKVIKAADSDSLAAAVALAIAGGFQPFGSPLVLKEGFLMGQAVTQGTPDGGGTLPANQAAVTNADVLPITNSAGSDSHNATAAVSANAITGIKLAATVAFVDNSDTVPVANSSGADAHNATAAVANGVVTNVKLAATVAIVDNGDTFPGVTGSGTTATFAISNGVITGIVLS